MKAIVYHNYGPPDVLKCEDVEKPAPKEDEVLIKVRATSVNPLDVGLMKGKPYSLRLVFGVFGPKTTRPGVDVAGVVEAVGGKVSQFKPGDEVFGACRGTFAEYVCAPDSKLARKPNNMTFEQAASVPVAGITALQGLRDKGHIQPGQKVLVNAAAGGVGMFAMQIAKAFGAEVTGVCSTKSVKMVRAIGADHVIDYTHEDFTAGGLRYDIIFDCVCNHSLSECRRVLKAQGCYITVGVQHQRWTIGLFAPMIKSLVLSPFISQKLIIFLARINKEDLTVLCELMQSGKITPVVDRSYSLSEAVEAVRYFGEGHARGKVILSLES